MEFTSTVLYGQEMAYYNVLTQDGYTYKARLLSPEEAPSCPKEILLKKVEDRWVGDADADIVHFLTMDIERNINGGHKH
jgi:hypothetical protein